MRSAPGVDGLSNLFIKKYWQFLRIPLLKYANHCFLSGHFTTNFRSAAIKLIPKKGSDSNIKNWRPISLLSNMYKIISRAINTRLNSVVNRICSRAQKGFNSKIFTQEVLINVMEAIRFCETSNISGAVVAVDMAKTFDTLSHAFLREVFSFFNMGPNLVRWLTLLGENRQACILLEDGSYSRNFNLDCGRAQGDNISPNTFNFAEQILIFKIELDPCLAGIALNNSIPPQIPYCNDPHFVCESGGETFKNESLADDNTTILLFNEENLINLRTILNDFGLISGLKCNFDKTMILPIGKNLSSTPETAGFAVCDKIKLLGVEINSKLDNIDDLFLTIGEKILNLILFWSRFRLSLCGRIAIVKTLLIPQINYLGCFLTPSRAVLDGLQEMLNDFSLHGLKVSKDRLYLPPEKGGLGLIHLGTFLMAQKCSWIKRAHSSVIDNWRVTMRKLAPKDDVSLIRLCDVDRYRNPILFDIIEGYETFVNCNPGQVGHM